MSACAHVESFDSEKANGVTAEWFASDVNINPANAGIIRLANNESIQWRNYANTANLALGVNSSNQLAFAGSPLLPMVYPGAGIPNSTGSAWGTSYTTTGSGTVVALATSPTFTGTPSLPTGATAVTQSPLNATTKVATTAYADAAIAAAQAAGVTVNAQGSSVSAYTAVLGDANNLVTMSDGSASTFTVPPNSSVAFPVGAVLTVIQYGAGQITLTQGSGVTFYNPSSLTTRAQYSTVALVQVSANTWVAGGDLS